MRRLRTLWLGAALAATLAPGGLARAADLVVPGPALPEEGIACENPVVRAFPAVYLGHFTGGYSHYLGEGGSIVLDWRDEKLCFPSLRSCNDYMRVMRRDFRRPEGYFTCLPIR